MIWLHSDSIVNHSLFSEFGRPLSYIFDRDSRKKNYIKENIDALDLDAYEIKISGSSSNHERTVDAVVGICNERQGEACNIRHLLVELRMRYENVNNLSPTEIHQKDMHSRVLLSACPDRIPIDPLLCLLFDPSKISQAESWHSRTQNEVKDAKRWRVFSPSTFCNFVNVGRKMPYTPKQRTIALCERLSCISSSKDLDLLEKNYQDVRAYLTDCRSRYEIGECKCICNRLTSVLKLIKAWEFYDEEQSLQLEILIEDIQRLLESHNGAI